MEYEKIEEYLMERNQVLVLFFLFFFFPVKVKNFTDVHPDYGARIQSLLDKYNAESGKKVR